ncbi:MULTISPECIES: hypothetical protein [Bradyrhizobium]|uniref:hypothetical protein n=1 Tax=Bradyrhizobium TaxID=374 RepID=UPI00048509A1|nr:MULTISPECIES: hypothetical protein [Bradyrhizobium]MCS3451267.1 pimeloyl-ACP methyl ester carboxylesterase [Bradyrhizobium elkanii]MCS3566709.1 pimeloyl-ACP methyl ester carboxylesterase [Bradyrhizobium elkanii]MCW2152565.1 pimeloyl-ACP methyl ester carboxylesterase [Bradyrhizobium elkanii]MCW2357557.1 pimeloyl-ACP methyl ester carboxylesterase [Bradyrhizobium elkanii]MCW2376297.1 pimeloyl-ACP methyl ester carboxylesterase [Bradyrhizobium elkanii]
MRQTATPKNEDALVAQITRMWETGPNWTDDQLRSIRAKVLVVNGDHDEAIKRAVLPAQLAPRRIRRNTSCVVAG